MATPTHKVRRPPYGYVPTEWICILFVVLFSITTLLHTIQALIYKRPKLLWILPTIVICGIAEIIGWGGRLASSHKPFDINFFLIQISTTILAPTFLTAGLYTVLGTIIKQLGSQYSRLAPQAYLIAFITADAVALIVQAVGGAKASIAFQNGHSPNPGGHVMLIGIVLQLVGILFYIALATEFFLRFHFERPLPGRMPTIRQEENLENPVDEASLKGTVTPSPSYKGILTLPRGTLIVIAGMAVSTFFVLLRTGYRTVELSDGWTGRIITTQRYFNYLDGAPICIALFTLNVLHPRFVF